MQKDGYEPLLKKSCWCLLKRKENLTEKQEATLENLLQYNLKSIRAYLLKEDFNGFWAYVSPSWAGKFLDRWCTRVMRSKIEPMKKVATKKAYGFREYHCIEIALYHQLVRPAYSLQYCSV